MREQHSKGVKPVCDCALLAQTLLYAQKTAQK